MMEESAMEDHITIGGRTDDRGLHGEMVYDKCHIEGA
jgi:hypothetical protein